MNTFNVGSTYLFVRHYLVLDNGIREFQSQFNFPARSLIRSEIIALKCIAEADSSFTFYDCARNDEQSHVFSDGNGAYFYNQFLSQDNGFKSATVRDRDTFDEYMLVSESLLRLLKAQFDGSIAPVQVAILSELNRYLSGNGYIFNLSVDISDQFEEERRGIA